MAKNNVRDVLINLARKEPPTSSIAKVLAFYYPSIDFSERKSLFEGLINHYAPESLNELTEESVNNIASEENSTYTSTVIKNADYRIKNITIANLRGIPEKDKDNVPFGINLVDHSAINNAIILANNGTGKSSIFSGLEMLFTQQISEKKLRSKYPDDLKPKDYEEYLKRFPSNESPFCEVQTSLGKFNLINKPFDKSQLDKIIPSNHFISDFTIYDLGQKDFDSEIENQNSFHTLIAKSLGLGDFIHNQTKLKEAMAYGKKRTTETGRLKKLKDQKEKYVQDEKFYSTYVDSKRLELSALKADGNFNKQTPIASKRKKLKELIDDSSTFFMNSVSYTRALDGFLSIYLKTLSIEKNQNEIYFKDFLISGLKLMDNTDACPFCESKEKSKQEIKETVEQRIISFQKAQEIDQILNERYKDALDYLSSFYNYSLNFYNKIQKELTEISVYEDLSELFEIEQELYKEIESKLNNKEVSNTINHLKTNDSLNRKGYKILYDLITENSLKYYESSITKLDIFNNQRLVHLERSLSSLATEHQSTDIFENIALIESEIKKATEQLGTSKKNIEELQPQIQQLEKEVDVINRIRQELEFFIPSLDTEINSLINEAFAPIKSTVESILASYLKDEKIKLSITQKEQIKKVDEIEVINNTIVATIQYMDEENNKEKTVTPDIYFNTFRYKLFCLMVSLSLALANRKRHQINLPIVIDDVFSSSDFISKNSFANFLQKLIQLFEEYTPDMPLQLILFTHDDIIFRSAIDAISNFKGQKNILNLSHHNELSLVEKTMLGRLFDPKDRDSETNKFENGEEYWNLLYCIPKTLNQLIKA